MEDSFKRVTRSQKSIEVFYVSDDYVNKIVKPIGSQTNNHKNQAEQHGKKKEKSTKDCTPIKPISELRTVKSVTRSGRKITSRIVAVSVSSDSEEEFKEEIPNSLNHKPSALFEDDDISGGQIVGFHTPKRRNAIINKAVESAQKNISSNQESESDPSVYKTPFNVRAEIRKKIVKEADRLKEDTIFEASGSDYSPSESEDESSESSSEDSGIVPLNVVKHSQKKTKEAVLLKPHREKRGKESDYIFISDEYFEKKSGKILTSDHTLGKLKIPRLGHDQLTALLKSVNPNHQESIKLMDKDMRCLFSKWLLTLREGYSILLFGLGSKRNLLNSFHREHLKNSPVMVVNGYFPGLTLKEILDGIAGDLLELHTIPTQPHEVVTTISNQLKPSSACPIFLIIHNLDGFMLRNDKTQTILSQLAKIPKIHILASVDHINSPLLWDQNKLSFFNFIWEDTTSFLPYTEETSYESSIMVQRTGSLALAALKNVFQSLTTNSRDIFKLLLNYQLENMNKNLGMKFSELYRSCRNAFIVSSDLALRTQLTEFIDHQLVKWKKDTDYLIIPIEYNVLKQFQSEIEVAEG